MLKGFIRQLFVSTITSFVHILSGYFILVKLTSLIYFIVILFIISVDRIVVANGEFVKIYSLLL